MRIIGFALFLALAGCSKPLPMQHFTGTQPVFDPIAFWLGHHRSWGVVENRAGGPTDTIATDFLGTPAARWRGLCRHRQ